MAHFQKHRTLKKEESDVLVCRTHRVAHERRGMHSLEIVHGMLSLITPSILYTTIFVSVRDVVFGTCGDLYIYIG